MTKKRMRYGTVVLGVLFVLMGGIAMAQGQPSQRPASPETPTTGSREVPAPITYIDENGQVRTAEFSLPQKAQDSNHPIFYMKRDGVWYGVPVNATVQSVAGPDGQPEERLVINGEQLEQKLQEVARKVNEKTGRDVSRPVPNRP